MLANATKCSQVALLTSDEYGSASVKDSNHNTTPLSTTAFSRSDKLIDFENKDSIIYYLEFL